MDPKKLQFAYDVARIVQDICATVFNIHSDEQLEKVFGISREQMEKVINKIVSAMPDYFFNRLYPKVMEEIKSICAREFIFFQVQEKINDPKYKEDLSRFINIFCRDIERRLNSNQAAESKLREDKV